MANVVRDPKEHPDAVLGDFVRPDPIRTFGLDDVAFVYGSRYKQRFFTKIGDPARVKKVTRKAKIVTASAPAPEASPIAASETKE